MVGRPLGILLASRLFSRYVGETEKAIEMAFKDAQEHQALFLMDEADSFLSSRENAIHAWETTSINLLLKLLEEPPVPVVLCTNFKKHLDPALMRRIQHDLYFPVPGPAERVRIWEIELKKAGLEVPFGLEELQDIPLTGGLIYNAVRQASLRTEFGDDTLQHDITLLKTLANRELSKMGPERMIRRMGFCDTGPRIGTLP